MDKRKRWRPYSRVMGWLLSWEPRGYCSSVNRWLWSCVQGRQVASLPTKEGTWCKRRRQLHRTWSVVSVRPHKQTAALWAVSCPVPGPNENRLCPFYQSGGIMVIFPCLRVQATIGRLRSGRRRQAGIKERLSEVTQFHWNWLRLRVPMTNSVLGFFLPSICVWIFFLTVPNSAVCRWRSVRLCTHQRLCESLW